MWGQIPPTDHMGRSASGLLSTKLGHIFRFDAKGYSPAEVHATDRVAVVSTPWGSSPHATPIFEVRVPMKRLPEAQRDLDTLAMLPALPQSWDQVWRFQTVNPDTGLPMPGVAVGYYPNRVDLTVRGTRTAHSRTD